MKVWLILLFLSFLLRRKAHCAIRDHPSNRIMRDFYYPRLIAKEPEIPYILGLTASPTQNDKIGALEYALNHCQCTCALLTQIGLLKRT